MKTLSLLCVKRIIETSGRPPCPHQHIHTHKLIHCLVFLFVRQLKSYYVHSGWLLSIRHARAQSIPVSWNVPNNQKLIILLEGNKQLDGKMYQLKTILIIFLSGEWDASSCLSLIILEVESRNVLACKRSLYSHVGTRLLLAAYPRTVTLDVHSVTRLASW